MTCVTDLKDLPILPQTSPVGIAALVAQYGLAVPVADPCAVSEKSVFNSVRTEDGWRVFDRKYAPEDNLKGHLTFALRHETLDLLFLKKLFAAVGPEPIAEMVRNEPAGQIGRRAWYLYEMLLDQRIDLEDSTSKVYVDVLDSKRYFTTPGSVSGRHRVRDNLLGTRDFCPIIRRTPELEEFVGSKWDEQARQCVGRINPAIVARAASFMLLADSQASYQIEGERPPRNRLERWMRVVSQAGNRSIDIEELVRLQAIVVEGDHFITPGLRQEGGFIGERDWDNNPVPEFVSARHEDVPALLQGMLEASERMGEAGVDPVLQATALSFGFVFTHPFEDGNGRLHRLLMHAVLAERRFTPPGVTFPISTVLLDKQDEYGQRLRAFSRPLLPFIDWVPTEKKNVRVTNDTADLYRYGDYTELAEFLYRCVVKTISHDLPREIAYLKAYDAAKEAISSNIEMPDNTLSLLINCVRQNGGKLSKRRRENEFAPLSDHDVTFVEDVIAEAFADHDDTFPANAMAP